MKVNTSIAIAPTNEEISLVQGLADGKEAMKLAVELEINTNKAYEKIAMAKAKFNQPTNASLVALFMRNKLIK